MRFTLKGSVALLALCAGLTGSQAYAQEAIMAKIPFDFEVNGQSFRAGQYKVQMDAMVGTADVVSVSGQDGRSFAFALTTPASGHDPRGNEPILVFTRRENTYELSQVWQSGMSGRELSK